MTTSTAPCPICQRANQSVEAAGDNLEVVCAARGYFTITGSAHASWEGMLTSLPDEQVAYASAWVCENGPLAITGTELPLLRDSSPSVGERAAKLLQALAKEATRINQKVPLGDPIHPYWIAVSWSVDDGEARYLIQSYLRDQKQWINSSVYNVSITPAGHDYLDALRSATPSAEPMGASARCGSRPKWRRRGPTPSSRRLSRPVTRGSTSLYLCGCVETSAFGPMWRQCGISR